MRIELKQGCVCDSLTIDGKEEINLTDDERAKVWYTVCDYLISNGKHEHLNELLQFMAIRYGEYHIGDKPCECCGDIIETYTMKL